VSLSSSSSEFVGARKDPILFVSSSTLATIFLGDHEVAQDLVLLRHFIAKLATLDPGAGELEVTLVLLAELAIGGAPAASELAAQSSPSPSGGRSTACAARTLESHSFHRGRVARLVLAMLASYKSNLAAAGSSPARIFISPYRAACPTSGLI
jgi:hypothetical protein